MGLPQSFEEFVVWGFYGLLGYIFYSAHRDIKETVDSLRSLSLALTSLTVRLESMEKSLDRLDERLSQLESHQTH